MTAYYPILLDLYGKPCCIIGGGKVAERKAVGLVQAGALITVISPKLSKGLEQMVSDGAVQAVRQKYARGLDAVRAAKLIFAAANDAEVNAQVRQEAAELRIWVNSADEADRGDFILPATLRRGKLTVAVSTSGASPSLALQVRKELEAWLDEGAGDYVELLYELRMHVRRLVTDTEERQAMYKAMLGWDLRSFWNQGHRPDPRLREQLFMRLAQEPTVLGTQHIGRWLRLQVDECGQ